jgi:hypothetical protein
MKGLFIFTTICSLTGLFPLILGIIKWMHINKVFFYFLIFIMASSICELLVRFLIALHYHDLSKVIVNFYLLYEGLIFILIFYEWGAISKRNSLIYTCFFLILFWLIDNFVLNKISNTNSLYTIIYSIVTVMLSTTAFQQAFFNNIKNTLRDPLTIISVTLIINYSYRAVFESLYLFKLDFSNSFYFNAFFILIILNVFSNCTFTYAIHCMSQRKRLTSFY